jgi:hypothetical protein
MAPKENLRIVVTYEHQPNTNYVEELIKGVKIISKTTPHVGYSGYDTDDGIIYLYIKEVNKKTYPWVGEVVNKYMNLLRQQLGLITDYKWNLLYDNNQYTNNSN